MNEQLNKLIEQYETENPGKKACVQKRVYQGNSIASEDIYSQAFVNFIIASRPTCGKEQRKFLDEVEKHGVVEPYCNAKDDGCDQFNIIVGGGTTIHDLDFYPAIIDIRKVIKGE